MTAARVVAMSRIAVRFVVSGGFDIADALISRVERDANDVVDREPAARAFALSARVARAMWLGDIEAAAHAREGGDHVLRRRRRRAQCCGAA